MRIIISILILMSAFNASASVDCVVVHGKEGKQEIIPIKEATEITFGAQTMNVGAYDFFLENVSKYEFADSQNLGIEEITGDISGIKIDPHGIISFPNEINVEVGVYDTHGIKCEVMVSGKEINMRTLPADIYLVKIGSSSIKFLKK